MSLFAELRRRRVIRVALAYLAGSWLLIQVAETLLPVYGFGDAFRFAFPERRNEFLEEIDSRQAALLAQALQGTAAYRVLHPHPVDLNELFEHMQPFVVAETEESEGRQ